MNENGAEATEKELGHESGEGSEPLNSDLLCQIQDDIFEKMGIGPRNLRICTNDHYYLDMEVGILCPVRQDAEVLVALIENHLKPLKWWRVKAFPHPRTNKLILEARRRRGPSDYSTNGGQNSY